MAICQYTCQKPLGIFIIVTEILVIGIYPKKIDKWIRTICITIYHNVIYSSKRKESLASNSRGLGK